MLHWVDYNLASAIIRLLPLISSVYYSHPQSEHVICLCLDSMHSRACLWVCYPIEIIQPPPLYTPFAFWSFTSTALAPQACFLTRVSCFMPCACFCFFFPSQRHSMSGTLVTPQSLHAAVKVNSKLTYIPIAYVLLRMWGSVRYIFEVAHVTHIIYGGNRKWLYWMFLYLHVSDPLHSFDEIFGCVLLLSLSSLASMASRQTLFTLTARQHDTDLFSRQKPKT